ncbi:hypothetical protein M378DRAFT_178612 [Amanita muscaria Koide BX008]|uniref:Uncharacterized protein n=1 Tax=Amanita muscaria (strain Koide BX008) TaxID=946122 RepID=A0A0C2X6E6_AMAMK|nr:hypothetical protein M378DRAFT_178612 [Amanita muscaria Koide BX008]
MKLQLTKKQVRRVARRTVEALKANGYTCCLFGSAACSMIGGNDASRVPNDLDIVVFTNDDLELIKKSLEDKHDRFFLKDGKNGPYKVLWYSICWSPELNIKVDILKPGKDLLGIPRIPSNAISFYHCNIPVMPFLPLLILKVQGWRDHRVSRKPWYRKKMPQDKGDIERLLSMVDDGDDLRNYMWLEKWFMKNANKLVKAYVCKFPESSETWRSIGFDV